MLICTREYLKFYRKDIQVVSYKYVHPLYSKLLFKKDLKNYDNFEIFLLDNL